MDSDIALWGLCYTISIVVFLFMGLYFAAFVAGFLLCWRRLALGQSHWSRRPGQTLSRYGAAQLLAMPQSILPPLILPPLMFPPLTQRKP